MFVLRDRGFYKKTALLMLPVILQQLITVGINFLDNIMIGSFGEVSIAAAAFSNQAYAFFQFICMGLGSGAVVMSSQFWGRKEREPMLTTAAMALRVTAAICLVFTLLGMCWPRLLLRAFTGDTAVITRGGPYMRLIGATFLLSGLSSTATYLMRSVGKVRIPLIGSAIAFFLNLFFNWVFIFGKLGAPRLELLGAAVGTVIARA
ncbi:MAG: polysaccharide biosynthesis C-terminal domain-containing protein, partial [Oscillospiraceae bacterium]|nr:polysaccharide biosynthesis C-terminal domain-containing protein [Oscillospiraceae bacterium]